MSYLALGASPVLPLLLRRLAAQGMTPAAPGELAAPSWLPAGGSGLYAPGCWLALESPPPHTGETSDALLELNGLWLEPGVEYGFMLFVGCADPAPASGRRLLDLLAPAPGAWLRCGPHGSALYTRQMLETLLLAWPLSQEAPGAQPHALDWQALLCRQLEWAERVRAQSENYLHSHGLAPASDPADCLRELSRPPQSQAHFAANLARALLLALAGHEILQQTLLQMAQASQPPSHQ